MLTGLVIAAGESRRMGPICKLSENIGGQALIVRSVASIGPFCRRIVVVTGAYDQEVAAALLGWDQADIVYHGGYRDGMYSSIKAGLAAADPGPVLFLPGDCPFVGPVAIAKLLAAPGAAAVPTYQGRPGHPVFFGAQAVQTILAAEQFYSLRDYFSANPPERIAVTDPGILWDVDTPEDLARARRCFRTELGFRRDGRPKNSEDVHAAKEGADGIEAGI